MLMATVGTEIGQEAPDFTLENQEGEEVIALRLSRQAECRARLLRRRVQQHLRRRVP